MPYTSVDQVRSIIKLPDGYDPQPHLDAAAEIVAAVCLNSNYTDDHLELIERYVAAHFIICDKPRRSQEKADEVAQTFHNFTTDLYFNNTRYGQSAIILDTAGNLAALQNNLKKGGKAITKYVGHVNPPPRWYY